jgi:zinc transporter ZupT
MKPSILVGICVGLATGAWMLAEYALGLHDDPAGVGRWTGFVALIFPVLGAYWLATRAPRPSWPQAIREGLLFGFMGGVVGGAAIYLYFTVVNPSFSVGGRPADADAQALTGFAGSLILGPILTIAMKAVFGRKEGSHG